MEPPERSPPGEGRVTLPTLTLEVAFGDNPFATSPTWTDISSYVQTVSVDRGRKDELAQFSTGTATFKLKNNDRRFDPEYASGAYYPNVTLRKRVRFSVTYNAVTYRIYDGYATAWQQSYNVGNRAAWCSLECDDLFALLAPILIRTPLASIMQLGIGHLGPTGTDGRLGPGRPLMDEEPSGTRILRILNLVGVPSALYSIAQGKSVMRLEPQGTVTGKVLDYLQKVAASELGKLYVGTDGKVHYEGRFDYTTTTTQATSQATFVDTAGSSYKYEDLKFDFSDKWLTNEVTRTRDGGEDVRTVAKTSQTTYGVASGRGSATGLLNATNADLGGQGRFIVNRFKDPKTRVTDITVAPLHTPATLWPQVLGRELGDRITISRTPQGIGSAVSNDHWIENVSHTADVSTQSWSTSWGLSDVDTTSYFRLGTSHLGPTGTDVLAA